MGMDFWLLSLLIQWELSRKYGQNQYPHCPVFDSIVGRCLLRRQLKTFAILAWLFNSLLQPPSPFPNPPSSSFSSPTKIHNPAVKIRHAETCCKIRCSANRSESKFANSFSKNLKEDRDNPRTRLKIYVAPYHAVFVWSVESTKRLHALHALHYMQHMLKKRKKNLYNHRSEPEAPYTINVRSPWQTEFWKRSTASDLVGGIG